MLRVPTPISTMTISIPLQSMCVLIAVTTPIAAPLLPQVPCPLIM